MLLPLQTSILYGPVNSRRFGRSLGINLSPGSCKLCSFNCAYCHYGKTERLVADARPYKRELPAYPEIIEEVQEALRSHVELDAVTFSGNRSPASARRSTNARMRRSASTRLQASTGGSGFSTGPKCFRDTPSSHASSSSSGSEARTPSRTTSSPVGASGNDRFWHSTPR